MKTGFRFALHHQAALKEQCIGILPAQRQRHEILHRAAHRDVRNGRRRSQSTLRDLERQSDRHILDMQAKGAARQLDQTLCDRLPSQQMIHHVRHHARGQASRDESQRMQHGHLQQSGVPFCHVEERSLLIRVKRIVQ
jgi:hypothetical protein